MSVSREVTINNETRKAQSTVGLVSKYVRLVRFQVLTAASMMFRAVFWVVLPCKMIVDRRFRLITDDGGSTHL
jgi:hypothetical protein